MLLSEIEFASFLAYSPRGEGKKADQSRSWVRRIKNESTVGTTPYEPTSTYVAKRLRARLDSTPFVDWLNPDVLLIPAPSSALLQANSLWVPYRIAQALVTSGLGRETLPCLKRVEAVRKSATARTEDRPSAKTHYESMRVDRLAFLHDDVIILDDVITRGATLLAAVSRVQEALPGARVRGFAVVRTLSDPDEFTEMFAPVTGWIALAADGQTTRRP